jgi:hypothetical protein
MKYAARAVFVAMATALVSASFLATADVHAEDLETPGSEVADEAAAAETPVSGAAAAETAPAGTEAAGKAGKKSIRVVAPYLGTVTNVYESEERGLELKDSSLLKGLYVQWVRPDVYQWNVFISQASDINYSTMWGGHFIFDYYFDVAEKHRNVIGAGFEFIRIDMDAGDNLSLNDFTLLNNISIPYLRVGRYFLFGSSRSGEGGGKGKFGLSVLPWLGIEYELVNGELSGVTKPPAPPIQVNEEIEDRYVFPLVGLNLKATFFHFIDAEVKYAARFDADVYFSDVSAIANVFFTRHWGLSYRFKYFENINGSIAYSIWGVAAVF